MSETPLLKAQNLSCTRGENLLFNDLNFTLSSGQCLHLTGPNGSGKTSLLKIVCGLNDADSGKVRWGDHTISNSESYLRISAYIGHKDGLKNELTAIENLRFQQRLHGQIDEDKLDSCLAQLEILACADLLAQSLSFGQRRRLAFARLLLNSYELWILDEPLTGIDSEGRKLIEQLSLKHLKSGGRIILTHHQSLKESSLAPYLHELTLSEFSPAGLSVSE